MVWFVFHSRLLRVFVGNVFCKSGIRNKNLMVPRNSYCKADRINVGVAFITCLFEFLRYQCNTDVTKYCIYIYIDKKIMTTIQFTRSRNNVSVGDKGSLFTSSTDCINSASSQIQEVVAMTNPMLVDILALWWICVILNNLHI